jgi:hypothetical protein
MVLGGKLRSERAAAGRRKEIITFVILAETLVLAQSKNESL